MPGFLSAYDGVERIDLGRDYWVDVKRCLSHFELQQAQAKMGAGRQTVETTGRQYATIDMNAFENEMIVLSVVDWNLDDENGGKWPLAPERALRQSVARLPAAVASQIFTRCNELNGPAPAREAAQFPGEDLGGDPVGDGGPAGVGVLPDPPGVLGEAWTDPSGFAGASVA